MPDLLKITTPLVNNNQSVAPKPNAAAIAPFNIQDTSRVIQTHNQSEMQKQNTGLLEDGSAPALLLNLLKDPAVAATYLKNIFLLEEIFKLLPANNKTVTPEIEQIFQSLIMQSDEIQPELLRQETASTMFQGELFDFLRQISDTPDKQLAVATLLKSINNLLCKDDILDAVANNLTYLRDNLTSSTNLTARLDKLIAQYRSPDAAQKFPALREETLALFQDIEDSVLFSPKLSKVLSISLYNLSRYNDNLDFLNESSFRLRQVLTGPQRLQYMPLIEKFVKQLQDGVLETRRGEDAHTTDSKVMDALIALVTKQSGKQTVNAADSAKIDHILHSLLSSPCNFTPLLHFIVPAMHDQMRAFAEIWINPKSDEKDMPEGVKDGKHFLLVIDVDTVGRFEAEMFVHDKTIDFSLFCPPGYEKNYEQMIKDLPKTLAATPYRVGHTLLAPLERSRSLMDVFKSLPYKRVGVDVKI